MTVEDGDGAMGAALLASLEMGALKALVRLAAEGNAGAAASALQAVERVRKTRLGELHQATLRDLAARPVELCEYLGALGVDLEGVEARIGRKLKTPERSAWLKGQDDRLLEVRAVELGRMRRGDGDVPRWASRKVGV